jgi:endonuclease/exonuclease/phosphatase family metal-dependent hydrolase
MRSFAFISLALTLGIVQTATAQPVKTMTRNVYLGASLGPAIGAADLAALVAGTGEILREVDDNEFPTRAEGLAQEILEKKPDLVGLQEVAWWLTAPVSYAVLDPRVPPSANHTRYNYLDELLGHLNQRKQEYEVVVVQEEFDFEAPADLDGNPGTGDPLGADINGRLIMRDVILARSAAYVRTWNEQGEHFTTLLSLPITIDPLAFVDVVRGWTATDARVRGSEPFRFVNTHLEAFDPFVREAQAGELVAPDGPATSDLPVILVGDLNSDDDTVTFPNTLAYELLLDAGMVPISTDEPLSCCLNSSFLGDADPDDITDFDHQVDHIMTRDPHNVLLRHSEVTGLEPVNGFWNSDHAGVFSRLRLRRVSPFEVQP